MLFDYTGRHSRRWRRVFPYTRTALIAFGLVVLGDRRSPSRSSSTYTTSDLALERADTLQNHLAVTGLAAVISGAQLFVFTLLLHGTMLATTRGRPRASNEPVNAPVNTPINAPINAHGIVVER